LFTVTGSRKQPGAAARRRVAWQAVVALSAIVLLFGDVFRAVHLLTARHSVCAEHGELVHRDEPARAGESATLGSHSRALGSTPAAQHHQHCRIFAMSRAPGTAAWAREAPVVEVAFVVVEARPRSGLLRGVSPPVLAYAPKHGPPA
jgi:hypothetical protein